MFLILSAGLALGATGFSAVAPSSAPAAAFSPAAVRELEGVLRAHVAAAAREHKGRFFVVDEDLDLNRELALRRLAPEGARAVSASEAILRGVFAEKGPGRGAPESPVEVDFTLLKAGGRWRVVEEEIYSVGGRPRFAYTEDNQRMPVFTEPAEEPDPDGPPD